VVSRQQGELSAEFTSSDDESSVADEEESSTLSDDELARGRNSANGARQIQLGRRDKPGAVTGEMRAFQ
jgi:hypothetical protein